MTLHVNFVRSKYAQKKLAGTSSSKDFIPFELYSIIYEHQRKYIEFTTAVHAQFCLTLKLRETRGHGHLRHLLGSYVICGQLWLAKCCKIQQLAYLYSTTFIYVQQDIFIFNILYLYSTMRNFFQLQLKLFSFNKNICSTSIVIFI